ncbi:DUF885 family protein [Maribacter antarcticus]|uniref:DUF885 family protein n=1 Tax=Maribacter antarcticus TaxID=505250 RepID=UPI00047B7726|nr:DUF885 family protein [Maribacter antarcticus]
MKILINILSVLLLICSLAQAKEIENRSYYSTPSDYAQLVVLLAEFREFQKMKLEAGVPDYSPASVKDKSLGITSFQQRLKTIDTTYWSVTEMVDYHLVRAEMNGMEFQYRVVRPWSRDPSFYLQTQQGSGPTRYGYLKVSDFPVAKSDLVDFKIKLKAIPKIFEQAKQNLTEGAADFATLALQHLNEELSYYNEIYNSVASNHPSLKKDAQNAIEAVKDYGIWLEKNKILMTAKAGVGKENYGWLMKHVYLFPYSWDQIKMIVELEDNRVRTFQRLLENKNRDIPPIMPVQSKTAYKASVKEALDYIIKFLKDQEIFTMEDYLTIDNYFGSWHDFDKPWPEKHDYFFNFSHRDPVMEETHEMVGHHFDDLRADRNPHPIRGGIPPFKISTARHEGFAFALEELMMYAGYLDERSPHAKEIAYEQAAFRTVRALSDVYMHSLDWTLEDAVNYCVANAPHGELLADSHHLWYEMATTLRGVGHHMLMVVGKVQFMKLFRDRSNQLGDAFVLKDFMDEFISSGSIPFALTRWEITGYDDEIKMLVLEKQQND